MNDQDNPVQEPEAPTENSESAGSTEAPAADAVIPEPARVTEETDIPESAEPQATPVTRRWLRHPTKKVFGGVCGGLADFLGISEGIVRLLVLGLIFVTAGTAIALYLLFWLFLPVGTQEEGQTAEPTISLRAKHGRWFAYGIIGIGGLWLAANLGLFQLASSVANIVGTVVLGPGIFILVGFLILRRFHRRALREDFREFRSQAQAASSTAKQWSNKVRTKPLGLHRSKRDRVFAGVCGGLGEVLSVDPLLMRLAYVIVSVMTGFVLMAVVYLVLALVLPAVDKEVETVETITEPPAPVTAV
jgi:phage shock protein PspC (stress-responsive transcriptional regulator)